MLIMDIRDKIDITPGLSDAEFITRCYAKEIFQNFIDSKNLTLFDDVEKLGIVNENSLLCDAQDWEMYSEYGNSLIWTDDITRRLFRKKSLTAEEIKALTGGRYLLSVQADALKTAAQYILNTLTEMEYESVTITV